MAFISLDDGWRGNLKLLPIFEKYKVPMCIFITTGPIESGNYWWELEFGKEVVSQRVDKN